MWDPGQYSRFADHRSRPFHDLVGRVAADHPSYIVDLGCGSGELTATLAQRWPDAVVEGVDSSPEMLERAAGLAVPGRLTLTLADARTWRPGAPIDVLISNATLHWVAGHEQLLSRWATELAPGGWLALQVPGNFDAPSHVLLRELVTEWGDRLDGLALRADPVLDPAGYWSLLHAAGCRVEAWETTYLHQLTGADPVLEWTKGTALRPVLQALAPSAHREFLDAYAARLRTAYPPGPEGTLFAFRRVFAVARSVS